MMGGVEMNMKEFLKHGLGGSLAIAATEKLAARSLKKKGVAGFEYDRGLAISVGAVGGGFLGYYLGELVGNHDRNYSIREKAVSTVVGSASGAATAALIGNYFGAKREYERELAEEQKARLKQGE